MHPPDSGVSSPMRQRSRALARTAGPMTTTTRPACTSRSPPEHLDGADRFGGAAR
jgi:hypothetical protein